MLLRKRFYIQGIVQGVGFRPFVYNLAKKCHLNGWVKNNSAGVLIEAEGALEYLQAFETTLREKPPVLSQIVDIKIETIPAIKSSGFEIQKSDQRYERSTLISPDISICDDCLDELFDPENRRYRYPFINCTNCGPRFSIVKDIPYDRPNTTMRPFSMCPACQSEYEAPSDRRFHAQPNACPVCGPRIWLTDNAGEEVTGDPVSQVIGLLKEGKIIAIKGIGGFHLAVDATLERAVLTLRKRKLRYEKPLAVMVEDIKRASEIAVLESNESDLLSSPQRPICLLPKLKPEPLAASISPDNEYYGIMLPYTPLHYLILREGGFTALVMTSGNISETPIIGRNKNALDKLSQVADYFLFNDREIFEPIDDSVVRFMQGRLSYIRRGRGFVPRPVMIDHALPSVLAVGGELKSTVCLNKKNYFFPSQHLGDLENLETMEYFEQNIAHFQKILEIHPSAIAHDLHPDYLSTRWALQNSGLPVVAVQHHHAHIASVMAENSLVGEVIGFALDGTGYGPDGTIWGGEILIANETEFSRVAHFRPVGMPGGEKAIREPWRMAVAYNRECGNLLDTDPVLHGITEREFDLINQMLARNINSPVTSSCGRLFDAVAVFTGCRCRVGYEGQAAMQLEALLRFNQQTTRNFYPFKLIQLGNTWVIDWQAMFETLSLDLRSGVTNDVISYKFHRGIVEILSELADILRDTYQISRVALSGGCFQNRFLSENLCRRLENKHFAVYTHSLVPPNDGGLALGQAYVAAHKIEREAG